MKFLTITSVLALVTFVAAVPPFDPNGAKNVGNGHGAQFITGQCLSNADCASGCCAKPTGICSGPGASLQQGKEGCGFTKGGKAAAPAAAKPAAAKPAAGTVFRGGPPFDPSGAKNVGNGHGAQFIGGQCLNAADCASGCCAGPSGICSGVGAQTQAGKTGCGFSSAAAKPAAKKAPAKAPAKAKAKAAAKPAAAKPAAKPAAGGFKGGPPFDPSGAKNVGNGHGAQFIGGQCLSAADCASGCCAGPSGICSGLGAQTQAGKTGCGFVQKRMLTQRQE